mgnify:CR=1 FL=1
MSFATDCMEADADRRHSQRELEARAEKAIGRAALEALWAAGLDIIAMEEVETGNTLEFPIETIDLIAESGLEK